MWGQPSATLGARRDEAHAALDKVYDSIQRKTRTLEEKRRKQGEVYLKIQQRRQQIAAAMQEIKEAEAHLEDEKQWLDDALGSRWFQDASQGSGDAKGEATAGKRIRINVGGQVFETTGRVLRRDPESVLAGLVARPPPDPASCPDGAWFFERDWWVFRSLLQWLREGESSLPRSKPLLRALHAEARFFGMSRLRDAVRRVYTRIAAAEAEADAPSAAPAASSDAGDDARDDRGVQVMRTGRLAASLEAAVPHGTTGWPYAPASSSSSSSSSAMGGTDLFSASASAAMQALLRGDGQHLGTHA